MQYIRRALHTVIADRLTTDSRLVLLLGPRQSGKTTLAIDIMQEVAGGEYLAVSGEDPRAAELISSCDLTRLQGMFSGYRYVLLDEAQHIPNVGTADRTNVVIHALSDRLHRTSQS